MRPTKLKSMEQYRIDVQRADAFYKIAVPIALVLLVLLPIAVIMMHSPMCQRPPIVTHGVAFTVMDRSIVTHLGVLDGGRVDCVVALRFNNRIESYPITQECYTLLQVGHRYKADFWTEEEGNWGKKGFDNLIEAD